MSHGLLFDLAIPWDALEAQSFGYLPIHRSLAVVTTIAGQISSLISCHALCRTRTRGLGTAGPLLNTTFRPIRFTARTGEILIENAH